MRKNSCAGSDYGILQCIIFTFFFFFWDNMTIFLWTSVKQWVDYKTMHGFKFLQNPAFVQIQAFFTETLPTNPTLQIQPHKAAFVQGNSFQPCLPIWHRVPQIQNQSNPISHLQLSEPWAWLCLEEINPTVGGGGRGWMLILLPCESGNTSNF